MGFKKFKIVIDDFVRYNDGIKDKIERFIIRKMGFKEVKEEIGKVFSSYKGDYKKIIKNTTISNELAFLLNHKFLFLWIR